MAKKISEYASGIIFFCLFTITINLAISLKLLFPASVIEWAGSSKNPLQTLWLISTLSSSFIIIILKLGVKLPSLKVWVERPEHPFFNYLFGVPFGLAVFIFIIAGLGLIVLGPVCESPLTSIEVSAQEDGDIIGYDGNTITAKQGAKLTLTASISENSVVFCSWSSVGSAINTLGPQSSCTTQTSLAFIPSRGIVTLIVSKSFCSVKTIKPIEIIVAP